MKADLHLHSKYSDRPSEWFLRRIGAPESFVEPLDVYRYCRERGMDFVTLTDHNCIDGALSIAHLPGTFLSVETTTYFPDDGCKIHCLAHGITEEQFAEIQKARENIYDLRHLLEERNIVHTIAHPLYSVNGRLSVDHIEKLILLFRRFELVNGAHHDRAAALANSLFKSLTPEIIAAMAERQKIEPLGEEPWRKVFTGGSDDHCGIYAAAACTETPGAMDVEEFLEHLRADRHKPVGESGSSLRLAHSLYHIAYQYYNHQFSRNGNGNHVIAELFRRVAGSSPSAGVESPGLIKSFARRVARRYRLNRLSSIERDLVETVGPLLNHNNDDRIEQCDSVIGDDRRAFKLASLVGQQLGFTFMRQLAEHASEGRLIESLQAFASLGPVALSLAPYIAAFRSQHSDEPFLKSLLERFPHTEPSCRRSEYRAWFTDTFGDINGVVFSIRTIAGYLGKRGKPIKVITSLNNPPEPDGLEVVNFPPLGEVPLPEYEEMMMSFPPFLEIIEYLERENIGEVIVSTPGPLGLTALAAARLLGLRKVGLYHTDIPRYARSLTGDDTLESIAWRAMQWFYGSMDTIYVPSLYYINLLAENGFDKEKMKVLPRGVDLERFNPSKRKPEYLKRYGVNGGLKYLYVGRVSREKNVEVLLKAFQELSNCQNCACDLVVVGDGPERKSLERKYAAPNIVFTGYLKGEELAQVYAASDVFVFPSATDTFGNVVLEALASGLPVIVSDEGGPPEIIASNQSGLIVSAGKVGALAEAMFRIAGDEPLRAELRERALKTANEYSWDLALTDF